MKSYADDKVFQKYLLLVELKAAKKGAEKELKRLGEEIRQRREELRKLKSEIKDCRELLDKMALVMDIMDGWLNWEARHRELEPDERERRKIELMEKLLEVMSEVWELLVAIAPELREEEPEYVRRKRRAKAVARW